MAKSVRPRKQSIAPLRSSLRPTLLKLAGAAFVLGACAITLLKQYPTRAQIFAIYTLVGIGIALLLIKRAVDATANYQLGNLKLALTGGVTVPFILFVSDPIGHFKSDGYVDQVNITVFVHGTKGRQDMILRQQGHVIMDLKGERKRAAIDENGQAHFQNLHQGDSLRLNIDFSEPYKAIHPDCTYVVSQSTAIYLPVALQGVDQVQGIVLHNNVPLAGVIAKIGTLSVTSDNTGNFTIRIPPALQAKQYKVWLTKPGFKSLSVPAFPQTGQAVEVTMERELKIK